MRLLPLLLLVLACGKSGDKPAADPGSGSQASKPADATTAAATPDAQAAIDAAVAAPEPPPPPVKTGIELVAFKSFNEAKLGNIEKIWVAWIRGHFEDCESDEPVEATTTTAKITFAGDDIKFELPKLPPKLAACVKQKIRTPYYGYRPTPPAGVPKQLVVEIKVAAKGPPEPPDTSPVKYVASKVKGARARDAVTKWLDANVARKLKPCLEDTPIVQDLWKISFEIDAAGKLTKAAAPGDANVATCVQKILDGLTAPKGPGTNTVELVYAVTR